MAYLNKKQFEFYRLDDDANKWFFPCDRLSDVQSFMLRFIAETMNTAKKFVWLWSNSRIMWYLDEQQSKENYLFFTENNILIFIDENGTYFRVTINF